MEGGGGARSERGLERAGAFTFDRVAALRYCKPASSWSMLHRDATEREELIGMGDRANVVLRDSWPDDLGAREAVFLYSHWGGSELPETLRRALARRWRWDDSSYLARIVFQEMLLGAYDGETGFGVSTRLTDNEYPLLVLHGGRVYVLEESKYTLHGFEDLEDVPSVTFSEYIDVEPRTWANVPGREPVDSDDRDYTDSERDAGTFEARP